MMGKTAYEKNLKCKKYLDWNKQGSSPHFAGEFAFSRSIYHLHLRVKGFRFSIDVMITSCTEASGSVP
jgi:hypothetical protein